MFVLTNLMKGIILFLIGLILLSGCVPPVNTPEKCSTSYSLVNGACCLDKNQNQVCDRDEVQQSQTFLRAKPLLVVAETCDIPRFDCLSKQLTSTFVKVDLRLNRDEKIKIKEVSFPELKCNYEFDVDMNFNDEHVFLVPCSVSEDAIRSSVAIEAVITPVLRHSNGQVYDYGTPTPATLNGEIAGVVS